ncbi:MAG: hypothetical protein PHG48_09240 [Eubacteriales bacterium]|nr:hypothetical protein [Eubacteriales bacterium]
MLDYKLKIGLVPERRFLPGPKRTGIFNPDYAVANKNKALAYIRENFADADTEFFDLEFLNEEGLLSHVDQCEKVAAYFREKEIDALFIINCNFGNEEAAGKIAQRMGKPVLLWGPRDRVFDADGTRYTDTQCGLFAIGTQLNRHGIRFSYIENCDIEDKAFSEGLNKFLSVACMLKNFRKLRIVQVGSRVRPFNSVMINEMELMEKFGIEVVPVNMAEAADKLNRIYKEDRKKLEAEALKIREKIDTSSVDDELLIKMAAFIFMYKEFEIDHKASLMSTECWTSMNLAFGAMPCLAMSVLADLGLHVLCESDIYGAVTAALLSSAARGKVPPIFGEFTSRNPGNDNSELLWHCGPFALSLKKEGVKARLFNARPSWQLKDGDYTLARFQAARGKYYLLGGNIKTTDGPETFGTYIWAEIPGLTKVERKLVEGPYIHHVSEICGSYADTLKEFCRFVPELEFDDLYN